MPWQWQADLDKQRFLPTGLSDWLDGFVARRYNQGSVIGSYLDPLADKVLIGCTVGALAHEVIPLKKAIQAHCQSTVASLPCQPKCLYQNLEQLRKSRPGSY